MDEILEELQKQTKILQSISKLEGKVIKKQHFAADNFLHGEGKSLDYARGNHQMKV